MKTPLLPLLALPGFFLWNPPAQAKPYQFFPNRHLQKLTSNPCPIVAKARLSDLSIVNPGIQRSIIMPQSDSGYGRAPYPVRRGGGYSEGGYYGRPSRETTIINGGDNCFNCRFGGADYGRDYGGRGGYGRGNPWR